LRHHGFDDAVADLGGGGHCLQLRRFHANWYTS